MKKLAVAAFATLLALTTGAAGASQNTNNSTTINATTKPVGEAKKRGPVFRSTKEQIKQAQATLKQRGFYAGEATGKLDEATRAGLKKYQEAEGLKVTGTLNRATLEKMNIELTERQKATG